MMSHKSFSEIADRLVATRYPYEVRDILREIEDEGELTLVVAAALARSLAEGHDRGYAKAQSDIRARLGL